MNNNVGSLSSPVSGTLERERGKFKEIFEEGQGFLDIDSPRLRRLLTAIFMTCASIGVMEPHQALADGNKISVSAGDIDEMRSIAAEARRNLGKLSDELQFVKNKRNEIATLLSQLGPTERNSQAEQKLRQRLAAIDAEIARNEEEIRKNNFEIERILAKISKEEERIRASNERIVKIDGKLLELCARNRGRFTGELAVECDKLEREQARK